MDAPSDHMSFLSLGENGATTPKCPYSGQQFELKSAFSAPTISTENSSETEHSDGSSPASSHTHAEGSYSSKCPIFTQEVDPLLIKTSLEDRISYLTDFLNFTTEDADVITKIAPYVHDVIPDMVDGMYAKLFEFDITKKVFMSRNVGFDGPLPRTLEDLTLDSPQIVFRKVFMKAWARKVLTADYSNEKTWAYMDKVGIMHTGASPFKHQRTMGIKPLNVPYRDIALMLGWVQNVLQTAVLDLPEDRIPLSEKVAAVSALNKVIWIQNDLFSRHYIGD